MGKVTSRRYTLPRLQRTRRKVILKICRDAVGPTAGPPKMATCLAGKVRMRAGRQSESSRLCGLGVKKKLAWAPTTALGTLSTPKPLKRFKPLNPETAVKQLTTKWLNMYKPRDELQSPAAAHWEHLGSKSVHVPMPVFSPKTLSPPPIMDIRTLK